MRQIKFRGRRLPVEGGGYVYGFYVRSDGDSLGKKYECHGIWDTAAKYWRILPDSVAQLVGIDQNGREVYEGDEIIGVGKQVYRAKLESNFVGKYVTLKETNHEERTSNAVDNRL